VAELLAAAPAPGVAPIARGDRLFGLLFAGGASEAGEVLALLGPAVAEALGHVRMVGRIALASEMEAEVELAAAVQQAFIPDGTARIIGPIELAASYVPASQCGGDWWAVHEMGDGRVLLLVADVTGHGIGAARITAAARGAHDVAVRLAGGQPDLPGLLQALDSAVRHVGAGHYHMTCFAAVIDPDLVIHFTSAGHVPPYLCRAPAGPGDRIAIDALVARGNPLGINRPPVVQVLEQTLRPGDLLLFHSDGLVDCTSPREERLGDRRMQRLLRQLASQSLDIGQIRDRLDDAIREHTGGSPQDDDITFIAVRGQAPPGNSME
jgi:serine phosphatase RsbU (regulator of sigma subunit)